VILVTEKLREFYAGGSKPCVMEILSIRGSSEELQVALKAAMQTLMSAFAQIAKEIGFGAAAARSKAEDAIVRLEGSLILARVVGDTACFERVLKLLPDMLTAA
jgi:TetR/AcrR family transcriptional repressor of lmrAB and yxaGH operons